MAITAYSLNGKKLFEVYVNGCDLRGRRKQWRKRGIESIRKAQDLEFGFERELARIREEGVSYTWSEWYEIALLRIRHVHRPSTAMNYQSYLGKWVNPHWREMELKGITRDHVYQVVFETFDSTLSAHSKKTLLKQIRRVMQMAVEDGVLDRNPTAGLQVQVPETEQAVLTNDQVKTFLQAARDTQHRFYPVWVLALMTGMRSGEMYALTWADIDLEACLIAVTKQWTNKNGICPTKTRRSRIVPVSGELAVFLKELRLQRKADHVLPRLKEWENGEQAQVTRDFCESIGITSVKFHDLRATFITNLLARGVPLAKVMSMVGHTQIKTTNEYLRKAGIEVRGGTEKLGYGIPKEQSASILQLVK